MAAAARAGLGEQSHSPAAQTVGNRLRVEGRQGVERDSPVSLKPVTYLVGAVLGEAREGPQAPPRCLRLQEGYILEAFNKPCGQSTSRCERESSVSAGAPCSARPQPCKCWS